MGRVLGKFKEQLGGGVNRGSECGAKEASREAQRTAGACKLLRVF